jgi:hypothetical protein
VRSLGSIGRGVIERGLIQYRLLALAVWFAFLAFARGASARTEVEVGYTRTQAFSAALRYLRVDLAYEVTEKDPDAAYLLFSFAAPELRTKSAHGSIELIERDQGVRVVVTLPELPSYQEEILKRGLLQKLHDEYGEPPAHAKPEPPKPDKRRDPDAPERKEPPPSKDKDGDGKSSRAG